MEISKRIVITFVVVSLIPILVIAGLSAISVFNVSSENAEDAAEALRAEELANLVRISDDTAAFIDERIQQYFASVYMMEKYAEDLFNGRLNASPQESYYWDNDLQGKYVPGIHYDANYEYIVEDEYENEVVLSPGMISFDVSCYYMPRPYYPTSGDPLTLDATTQYFLDVSSNMDNAFRAVHEMSEDYIWLYMGFDPGVCPARLFKNYPFDTLQYFQLGETGETIPPEDDYNPPIEQWYTSAAAIPIESNQISFTNPYGDPSTGLVISMGRPVYFDNGTLIGVVSADVTLDTINSNVLGIEVLDNGYAYLLNSSGGLVAHPDFVEDGQTLNDVEFAGASTSEIAAFTPILSSILTSDSGQTEFQKRGETWYVTYSNVNTTGFALVIVVPASDVIAPANNILSLVLGQTLLLTIVLGGLLAVVACVVAVASYRRANAVVEPIKEMTRLVEKMAQQDFTRSVTTSGAMFEEVGTTVDALLSFQEAVRYGNQAFVRGDLNRALANYQNLLEISQRLGIEIGRQTMLMNIGNVFRQRGDTGNAMDYYRQALDLAKELLEKSKEEGSDETDALLRIASVYHNMALVEMDRGNPDQATSLLEDAEAIDTTLGNRRGHAKRYDAMGLVLMKEGRYSQAHSRFEEALKTAAAEAYERSMAYIQFHMGELYQIENKLKKAEDAYNEAVRLGNLTEEYWLVVYAMQNLADVLDQQGKSSHEVRAEGEKLRRSIQFKKSVIFVIDYSGSMQAQNRIRAATQGAKEILHAQVNPQDDVSIIVFNSSYQEVLGLTRKGEHANPRDSPIVRALDSLRHPNYATAFYDALGRALEELDRISSSEHRWVIALTDGQDNSSEKYSLDAIEGIFTEEDRQRRKRPLTIEGFIRDNHLDVNLIIIGVGNELKQPIEARVRSPKTGQRMNFEELLESVCDNIPEGQYLSVVDSIDVRSDIEKAFQEVGVMMAQLEVGGSTTDY
ncbi:MAG: VWA domain-containing protein [Candidatus Thorarchaeota archaeon]|nr:VWA domain-containing protein [Candidatus Thorarchaeota archaeon]